MDAHIDDVSIFDRGQCCNDRIVRSVLPKGRDLNRLWQRDAAHGPIRSSAAPIRARSMLAEQRKGYVALLKKDLPEISNRQVAKVIGVNPSTVDEDVAAGKPAVRETRASNNKASKKADAGNPAPAALSGAAAAKALESKETTAAKRRPVTITRPTSRYC
jgi:hypothetical protein